MFVMDIFRSAKDLSSLAATPIVLRVFHLPS